MATLSRVLQDLDPTKRYTVRVRAKNNIGVTSEWSDAVYFEPHESALEIPEETLVLTPGVRIIIAQWTAPIAYNFDHYEFHISQTPSFTADETTLVKTLPGGSITVLDKYLLDNATPTFATLGTNETYYVQLYAVEDGATPIYNLISEEKAVTTSTSTSSGTTVQMLTADNISTGTLTAGVTLSGTIKTADQGSRLVIGQYDSDKIGMKAFDNQENTVLEFDTDDGSLYVAGRIESGYGPELQENGTFDSDISGWGADIAGRTYIFGETTNHPVDEPDYWEGTGCDLEVTADPKYLLAGDTYSLLATSTIAGPGTISLNSDKQVASNGDEPVEGLIPVDAGKPASASARILSLAGDRQAKLTIYYLGDAGSGFPDLGSFTSGFQTVTNDAESFSELIITEQTVPTSAVWAYIEIEVSDAVWNDEYAVPFVFFQIEPTAHATWVDDGVGSLQLQAGESGDDVLSQAQIVHTPSGTDHTNVIDVSEEEFINVSVDFTTDADSGDVPYSFRDRIRIWAFYYDDTGFVSLKVARALSEKGSTYASGDWSTTEETFAIPDAITGLKIAVTFIPGVWDDLINIDNVKIRRASSITSSVLRTSAPGSPRVQAIAGSDARLELYPTGRSLDYPAIISTAKDTLSVSSPRSIDDYPVRGGLTMRAGTDTEVNGGPTWAFNSYPVGFYAWETDDEWIAYNTAEALTFQESKKTWDNTGIIENGVTVVEPMIDFDTYNTRFTMPDNSPYEGLWLLWAYVAWVSSDDINERKCRINMNGSSKFTLAAQTNTGIAGGGWNLHGTHTRLVTLQAGNYYELIAAHTKSGGTSVGSYALGGIFLGGGSGVGAIGDLEE